MYDKSQMMRGTLEGCILKIISIEPTYGYEIVTKLQEYGFEDVKEGTIYPLLMRLEKKEYISSEFRSSPFGPSRKYFSLTGQGRKLLDDFTLCWQSISDTVNTILNMGE
jgi:PadR family transcriptional regulator PadR